jgi:hypothetical protein
MSNCGLLVKIIRINVSLKDFVKSNYKINVENFNKSFAYILILTYTFVVLFVQKCLENNFMV